MVKPLESQGIPSDVKLSISGTANELTTTWKAMSANLSGNNNGIFANDHLI